MSTFFLVATPIGNMEDVSLRALRVLGEVDVLACEDTRTTRKIFERHGLAWPETVVACHDHNESRAAQRILSLLDAGRDVAYCSEAGMPGISDPGFRLVEALAETEHAIDVLPGASAVETALVMSGLPTSSYLFKGFPPRKSGKRRTFLEDDAERPHTLVFFESPYRIGKLLAEALAVLGDRRAAVCLELTKKFQRVHRGYLSDLAADFSEGKPKGEATIVIAGHHPKFMRGGADDQAR